MKELTASGNNIVRSFDTRNGFIASVVGMARLYDNGYTAAYFTSELLVTYCEGDISHITGDNLEQERAAHLAHYNENEA